MNKQQKRSEIGKKNNKRNSIIRRDRKNTENNSDNKMV